MKGRFSLVGGLSGSLSVKLFGRSTRATVVAIAVNGKLVEFGPLSSLPRPPVLPPRPRKATVSLACPSATLGSPVAVSGTLRPGGPAAPIALTFTGPGGSSSTVNTTTVVTRGSYSARFTPRTPGSWTVTATFGGDRTRHPAASPACRFTVS
jgi:hypothetical protein